MEFTFTKQNCQMHKTYIEQISSKTKKGSHFVQSIFYPHNKLVNQIHFQIFSA